MIELADKLHKLSEHEQIAVAARIKWLAGAHKYQVPPPLEVNYTVWMMLAGRGAGKQLCIDTPIPTPSGWTRNGDLKAGDSVFDERGNVCTVVEAHPVKMPERAYRVTFNDGSWLDADGEHLWTTLTHRARKQMTRHGVKRIPDNWSEYKHALIDCHGNTVGHVGAETLTTEQILDTLRHGCRGDLNHCIPTTLPLLLPDVELPIDPYLLGSWLGDGSSKEQVIWGHRDDISLIFSHAQSLGYQAELKHSQDNTWKVRVLGLSAQLREIGVYGNKHVPAIYLRASVNQRLALLQGLMDTDGYQDAKAAEFCNTNRKLAEAVYELAVSLGEKPVMKESRAKLKGKDCGEKYRVTWRWNRFNPFQMPRKASKMGQPAGQGFKHGHRMIVSIEPIEPKPMRCITVDSPSRLYLAGEAMIPTHNTRSAAEALWWWAWTHPESRCLVLAPTSNDVKFTCFEGQSGLLSVIPQALVVDYNKQDHQIKLVNGSSIRGISGDSYERLRGPQFHFAWCCLGGTLIARPDGSQTPIEDIAIGDVVLTRHGPRRVTASGLSGNPNDMVTISCGETRLTITSDHPILIGDRWIPAGDIKVGDRVWAELSMMASHGTSVRRGTSTTSAVDTCIDTFGSKQEGLCQKGGWFTTSTTTLRTITSTICASCLSLSTWLTTRRGEQSAKSKGGQSLNRSASFGVKPRGMFARASCVVRPLFQRLRHLANFVLRPAQRSGEQTHSFQSVDNASGAGLSIWPSSGCSDTAARSAGAQHSERFRPEFRMVEVTAVERSPNQQTYGLTVEGEHEFVANGVVVHNCDELAAFQYLRDAWDMMMFGLRLGEQPRVIVTTTPKPKDLIIELVDRDDCIVDRASTYDNIKNLAPSFAAQLEQYKGTKLYEQEVLGEIVDLEDGKVVSRDMFRLWPAGKPFPRFEFIVQSYDCAFSEKTHNDPTACTTWGVFKPLDGPMSVLLIDCWAEHLSFPNLKPKVIEEFRVSYGEGKDAKKPDLILVEDKAAGISLIQELQKAHLPVRSYNPGRADKMQRLQIAAAIFAAGRVWLPESQNRKGFVRDWCEGFLSQICSFPDSEHDDYVDSASQAVRLLKDMGFLDIDPEPRYDDDDLVDTKPAKVNPYAI